MRDGVRLAAQPQGNSVLAGAALCPDEISQPNRAGLAPGALSPPQHSYILLSRVAAPKSKAGRTAHSAGKRHRKKPGTCWQGRVGLEQCVLGRTPARYHLRSICPPSCTPSSFLGASWHDLRQTEAMAHRLSFKLFRLVDPWPE